MKKIGILTMYHGNYNFGGLLQAYALPEALRESFNLSVEQVDYAYFQDEVYEIEKEKANLGKFFYRAGIYVCSKILDRKLRKRKQAFDQFIGKIPHSSVIYDFKTIAECARKYDGFICGGDQIWNDFEKTDWSRKAHLEDTKTFTLQFVPDNKLKISYAPSMAVLTYTEKFRKVFCEGISRLDAVSVREKKSIPVIQKITGVKAEVVVDPVLLLSQEKWNNLIEKKARLGEKRKRYLLCYLLGDERKQRQSIKKIANRLNLKIWTFPHITQNAVRKCDLFFGDIHDYVSGPCEFIDLVKNADLVITDSFHACVFSMIFETPFYVFERYKLDQSVNMNSRIYDFLEEYHLEQQLIAEEATKNINEIPSIDFSYAHAHWEKRRKESLDYLRNAMR